MFDASIYGAIRQPEQGNQLAQLAQVYQLQGLQAQAQDRALARDQQQNRLAVLARQYASPEERETELLKAGDIDGYSKLTKDRRENAKTQAEERKFLGEAQAKGIANHRDMLANVNDAETAKQWLAFGYQDPTIGPIMQGLAPMEQAAARIPTDPAAFQQWKQQAALGASKYIEHNLKERDFALKSANELMRPDGSGGYAINQPLLGAKQSVSKAGASNVSVKVDAKLGEGIASQVGPMLKESASASEGAARQIDAANRIVSAVDSNKLFTGPGAETRLTVAQISDTLGLGGASNAEKIANTRQALQGLSQLTLQGRAQMRGQGAITESESKLAERATSGDISMTPAEIKQLANAARRAATYMQSEHQRKLSVMKQNPALQGMVPFYDVEPVPAPPSAPAPASGGFKILGVK
jgi:hypothetical protein